MNIALIDTFAGVILAAVLGLLAWLLRSLIFTLTQHTLDLTKLTGLVARLVSDADDAEDIVAKYHDEIIDLKLASSELDTKHKDLYARVDRIESRLDSTQPKRRTL